MDCIDKNGNFPGLSSPSAHSGAAFPLLGNARRHLSQSASHKVTGEVLGRVPAWFLSESFHTDVRKLNRKGLSAKINPLKNGEGEQIRTVVTSLED
jgi:hypothetical protein